MYEIMYNKTYVDWVRQGQTLRDLGEGLCFPYKKISFKFLGPKFKKLVFSEIFSLKLAFVISNDFF